MPLSTKEPPHLAEHKTLIKGTESLKGTESRLFVSASAGLTMLMAGLCFKTVRRSITAHYANEGIIQDYMTIAVLSGKLQTDKLFCVC
jgi:hypothetical protein